MATQGAGGSSVGPGRQPRKLELLATIGPLLRGDRVADVVLPRAVDLEVAQGDALLADRQLLDHPAARLVAGDDRDLHAVEVQVLEGEAGEHDERLGYVALARPRLVHPVPDVGALERTPLHGGQVDLAAEVAADEDAEPVPGAELALALAGAAAHREGVAVAGRIGLADDPLGLPARQPLTAAQPDLPPGREVRDNERAQHH